MGPPGARTAGLVRGWLMSRAPSRMRSAGASSGRTPIPCARRSPPPGRRSPGPAGPGTTASRYRATTAAGSSSSATWCRAATNMTATGWLKSSRAPALFSTSPVSRRSAWRARVEASVASSARACAAYHRVVVHVQHPRGRRHCLGHLVHVRAGRQPGPQVEELPDSGFGQHPHGPGPVVIDARGVRPAGVECRQLSTSAVRAGSHRATYPSAAHPAGRVSSWSDPASAMRKSASAAMRRTRSTSF